MVTALKGSFPLRVWNGAFFVFLLIFPRLKSKRALSEAKKSIKQRILHYTIVVETSLKTKRSIEADTAIEKENF